MVLEIENAPGQPKWVWLPSLVPIISVGWNFEAKWRACGNADDGRIMLPLAFPVRSTRIPFWSRRHSIRAPRDFFIGGLLLISRHSKSNLVFAPRVL
jgi:hypothetical protein